MWACDKVFNANDEVCLVDKELNNHLNGMIEVLANEPLSTLGLYYKQLGIEYHSKDEFPFEGYILIGKWSS